MTSHEGGSNRQLGCCESKCFASQRFIDTIHLIEDLARLNLGDPILRVTLTVTHTNFGRLLGDRLIREDTDPDTTTALDVTGHGTTSSLDLTSRQATTAGSLEAPFAEGHLRTTSRQTLIAALVFLTELATIRLQHLGTCLSDTTLGRRIAIRLLDGTRARLVAFRLTRSATRTTLFSRRLFGDRLSIAIKHIALVNPDLDTDDTVGGQGFRGCVIDIGTQGMKRHATFAIPFAAGDFCTIKTTSAHHLDTLGTQTHRVLHRTLHGATEHNALFQLLSNGISDQLGINFRLPDFFNRHMDGNAHDALQIRTQLLNVFALLADHDARTSGINGNAGIFGRALDQHTTNRSMRQLTFQVLTYLKVFLQHTRKVLAASVPAGTPVFGDGQTEASRMNFLSHGFSLVTNGQIDVAGRLADPIATTLGAGGKTLKHHAFFDVDGLHRQFVDIGAVIVLGVGDCRLQHFLDDTGALFRAESQDVESLTNRLAAHQVGYQTTFLRREAYAPQTCTSFHVSSLLLGLLAGGVTLERPGQRKLAELVTDHILGDEHRDMLPAIVDRDRQADELGEDRRTTRPGLDRALVIGGANGLDLVDQVRINKRALFERTSHFLPLNACDGAERSCCSCACCCGYGNPWWVDPTG